MCYKSWKLIALGYREAVTWLLDCKARDIHTDRERESSKCPIINTNSSSN